VETGAAIDLIADRQHDARAIELGTSDEQRLLLGKVGTGLAHLSSPALPVSHTRSRSNCAIVSANGGRCDRPRAASRHNANNPTAT
jgi:hypothetical protein